MDEPESVSRWIQEIQSGNEDAAQAIWDRYFHRLLGVARKHVATAQTKRFDEEDVAIQVFQSFFKGAAEQRFPKLESRDDLWQILLMLTQRKAWREITRENAQKRGGGKTRGESIFGVGEGQAFGSEATEEVPPEFLATLMDELNHAMSHLNDPTLEKVATRRLEGYDNREIAAELGCHERTVERKIRLIRKIWNPNT